MNVSMRLYQLLSVFVLLVIKADSDPAINFLHPGNTWFYFSDSTSGGISLSHRPIQSDDYLEWTFELKRGEHYQWPYAGISRELTSGDQRSFTHEDTLVAEMCSNREGPVTFKLATFDPDRSTRDEPSSFRVLEYTVTVKTVRQQYRIPLSAFRIPDWYKTEKNIAPEDNEPFWDSLRLVQLIFNDPRRFEACDTLRLHTLGLVRSVPRSATVRHILLVIPVLLLIVFPVIKRAHKKNSGTPTNSVTLHPKKLASDPSDWERTRAYIEQHYTRQSLTVQDTAKALGFSESKLSRLINVKYPDGFRALIHELRVKEGKRLLRESEMNIGEIAYKLGYAVPSHFNREFRKRCDVSPGVFRRDVERT